MSSNLTFLASIERDTSEVEFVKEPQVQTFDKVVGKVPLLSFVLL